jgi:hypothetical protein
MNLLVVDDPSLAVTGMAITTGALELELGLLVMVPPVMVLPFGSAVD